MRVLGLYLEADLRVLTSCGGFDDYRTTQEFRESLILPSALKRVVENVFTPAISLVPQRLPISDSSEVETSRLMPDPEGKGK